MEPLYCLKNLKSLCIRDCEEPFIISKFVVDLSKFPQLEEYLGEMKYVEKLEEAVHLKTLSIDCYQKESLIDLSKLKELDTLEIFNSKIKSLNGCEKLEKLQCLYLRYNRSLMDISALEGVKGTLKALRIEKCGKIIDFSILETLKNLELLGLNGSNKITSISFIKNLKKLTTFVFSITVLDGDITPCMRMDYASYYDGKRNYNIRSDKLPKNRKCLRGNENIEMWRRLE